jgi:LuxR family transcriptional regulator, maltose regulon positive regulatory protein
MTGGPAGHRVLVSKLTVPAPPPHLVVRPRLHTLLDRGVQRQLTVVSGPLGAGKSTLMAAWAAASPVAWLSLDDLDNDPARLWAHLLAALHQLTGDDALVALSQTGTPTDAYFVSDVAAVLSRWDTPVRVVLDNFERLAPPAAESIALLLQHGLPSLRVVIATRGEPPSPVARLRLAGDVAEISASDLAFTAGEAAHYWSVRGREVDDPEDLIRTTEGLAAGVCHDEEALAELFRREVLGPRPTLRQFILRCSVVDRVCGGLAVAVTGRRDAAGVLSRLCAQGVLQRSEGPWYRYSLPLREFLRREADGDRMGPHRRAARWYAGRGEFADAVRHATAAKDWRLAAGLTTAYAPAGLFGPNADVMRELGRQVPNAFAVDEPEIAATLALLSADRGSAADTRRYSALAHRNLDPPGSERYARLRAVLHLAGIVLGRDDPAAAYAEAEELTTLLCSAALGAIPAAEQLHAVADLTIGVHRLWETDFDGAEPLLHGALANARNHLLTRVEAEAGGALALIAALRGDLLSAHELLALEPIADSPVRNRVTITPRDTPEGAAHGRDPADRGWAAGFAEGLVRWALGSGPDPRPEFVDGHPTRPLHRTMRQTMLAENRLARHRPREALNLLSDIDEHSDPVSARARTVRGWAYLDFEEPVLALRSVETVHRQASAGAWARIDAWLVEALASQALGRDGAVDVAIAEALALAGTGIVRPYADAGTRLTALIERRPDLAAAYPTLARLLDIGAFERPAQRLVEHITDREGTVLRFLPSLLTTVDIAQELCLSPNTVKTHIRSIYRKLDVTTRRDAVRRARELGLMHQEPPIMHA